MRPNSLSCRALSILAPVCLFAALTGCTGLHGKPPLPKYASVEAATQRSSTENFAALVPDADVIYFPAESAAFGSRSEPAAQLLDALEKTGAPLAIAWDLIDASQQPLLDELQATEGAKRETLIARLQLEGTGRAREHCRSVLRAGRPAGVRHIALASPAALTAKFRAGESLAPEEQAQLPSGFRAPAGDMEAFTERLRNANQADIAGAYRAHLLGQQFAADAIVRHFQSAPSGGKLLVFARRGDLESGRGIPFFVAQKVQLRQLVLGSAGATQPGAKLLTRLTR